MRLWTKMDGRLYSTLLTPDIKTLSAFYWINELTLMQRKFLSISVPHLRENSKSVGPDTNLQCHKVLLMTQVSLTLIARK